MVDGLKRDGGGRELVCKQLMHLWQILKQVGWCAFWCLISTLCSVHTVSPVSNASRVN